MRICVVSMAALFKLRRLGSRGSASGVPMLQGKDCFLAIKLYGKKLTAVVFSRRDPGLSSCTTEVIFWIILTRVAIKLWEGGVGLALVQDKGLCLICV